MKNQQFLEEDWDYAIILDCARYDVFQEVYTDYFSGNLEKRNSNASATPEWVEKNLNRRQNINWFSTNPFINGRNIKLNEFDYIPEKYETNPSRYIANVVDIWDSSWNSKMGTVTPEAVNKEFKDKKEDISDRRTVIHYMQPHKPFIGYGSSRMENMKKQSIGKIESESRQILPDSVSERLSSLIERLERSETAMKIGLMMSLSPMNFVKAFLGDSEETMKILHEENMRKALECVQELATDLDGKVVITSDHGEAFGEQGVWGHHIETHIPPLIEVPWLEVENTKS
ncbi:hypothetical protein [Candidatus Nanohalobium constans]|uniref:Sulfatase N-terminal domain-containing protein n=1 Tax=Candidatus Nanohalobium constans TaxID=2565781 RepID=A0A5Q0UF21_9ARCH|nr:hypothetical protein [Candidatus Nanohalobium constans]QGA80157.1 hypothetical protein LC1Nh_0254 [Candidatus Nanohalobium constans]